MIVWLSAGESAGLLEATNNGTLQINNTVNNTGNVNVDLHSFMTIGAGGSYTQSAGTTSVDATGGTLMGTGTIDGTVFQTGGTMQPGDPPGTLSITGNYRALPRFGMWRAQGDEFRTFLGDFVSVLPQVDFGAPTQG
jgi:hypothetical protein